MNDGTSIKSIFQQMASAGREVEVLQGTVTSENPLRIQIANDEKLIVGPNNVYVPRHLTDYITIVDIEQSGGQISDSTTETDGSHTHSYSGNTDSAGDPSHRHHYSGTTEGKAHSHAIKSFNIFKAKMTVYNALKKGEQVHILSFHKGKQYYVLDRTPA